VKFAILAANPWPRSVVASAFRREIPRANETDKIVRLVIEHNNVMRTIVFQNAGSSISVNSRTAGLQWTLIHYFFARFVNTHLIVIGSDNVGLGNYTNGHRNWFGCIQGNFFVDEVGYDGNRANLLVYHELHDFSDSVVWRHRNHLGYMAIKYVSVRHYFTMNSSRPAHKVWHSPFLLVP
jgi:hypothetical protein